MADPTHDSSTGRCLVRVSGEIFCEAPIDEFPSEALECRSVRGRDVELSGKDTPFVLEVCHATSTSTAGPRRNWIAFQVAAQGVDVGEARAKVGLKVGLVADETTSDGIIRALVSHFGDST